MSELEIRRQLHFYQNMLQIYRRTYEFNKRFINTQIRDIRKSCEHPAEALSYNPDPSGNNDTSWTCRICGEERKRF